MCVCVCMCMHVYECVCMCMNVYARVCMCMHVYECVYECVRMCVYVCDNNCRAAVYHTTYGDPGTGVGPKLSKKLRHIKEKLLTGATSVLENPVYERSPYPESVRKTAQNADTSEISGSAIIEAGQRKNASNKFSLSFPFATTHA